MKRVLFIGILGLAITPLQGMMQGSGLRDRLLGEVQSDIELAEVAIAPGSPAPIHAAGTESAQSSPAKDAAAAAGSGDVVVDIGALLEDASLQELFEKEPTLKTLLGEQIKKVELTEQKLQKILDIVQQLREADEEHSLPKKQRIIATTTELSVLSLAMMVYTFFLDKSGYNTAAVVQHYTAQSWLRNLSDANPLVKIVGALVAVGVSQALDYHVAMPYLGNAIGLAPTTIFIALGVILGEAKKINNIQRTKETVCQAAARFAGWVKSLGRISSHSDTSVSNV